MASWPRRSRGVGAFSAYFYPGVRQHFSSQVTGPLIVHVNEHLRRGAEIGAALDR
jgi:hypothetical protein